ncbi:MAG: RidA family protein [Chloroflexi bacterium]|nr:RidA family protein [Chloroflexota bacterium]
MAKNVPINPGWPKYDQYTFAPAVKRGNMLFISGVMGQNPDGSFPPDISTQLDLAFQRLGEVLAAAGATFDDVVKTTDYIATQKGYKATADVRRKYFKNGFPAATGVVVKELLRPGALVELDAIAMVG